MIERLHRSLLRLLLSTEHEVTNFTLEVIMTDELLLAKWKKKQDNQGFRLRPEAGRFIRSFSIPCPVL